ncbi:MAG: MFS transporter [Pseudomonadota bacterium]
MRASASPVYYGWFVLAASAVCELLAQGATSYAAGLFVLPLQAEFHLSRADANSSILILFLGAAVAAPLVGKLLDRYSIRLVMVCGAVIFSAALAIIASTASLWVMVLALFLPAAIGFMAIGPLTTSTLAARWFFRRRGLALGIAAVATSGGGLVVVPLLSQAIQTYGWRTALLAEAAIIAAIVIALTLLVLRDNPDRAGLGDHAENRGRPAQAGGPRPSPRWREILARRAFWIPSLALANISGTCQAIVVTIVPYGVQLGATVTVAAFVISAFAICAAITKVLAGFLADHVDQRWLLVAATVFMIAAQLLLWLFPSYHALLAGSCLAGAALGFALPTAAGLIAAGFGAASFGAAMGWTYALTLAFAILASRFIGAVFDMTHSYIPAFVTFLVLTACVLVVMLLFAPREARQPT